MTKLRRMKVCSCCQKKRLRGYSGAVLVEHILAVRKLLKTKGKEVRDNEFICTSCKILFDESIVKKMKKSKAYGAKLFPAKKAKAKKKAKL